MAESTEKPMDAAPSVADMGEEEKLIEQKMIKMISKMPANV